MSNPSISMWKIDFFSIDYNKNEIERSRNNFYDCLIYMRMIFGFHWKNVFVFRFFTDDSTLLLFCFGGYQLVLENGFAHINFVFNQKERERKITHHWCAVRMQQIACWMEKKTNKKQEETQT